MAGTTYAWTRDNTANVTGLAATGSGDISGTPNNVTGVDQTVTYTITPTSAAGCAGNTFTATVIVRSEPVGVSTPSTQTVCSDAAITPIVLSTSNGMAGTTYAWTRDNTQMSQVLQPQAAEISAAPRTMSRELIRQLSILSPRRVQRVVQAIRSQSTVIVRSEPVGVSTPVTQTVCSDAAITPIVLEHEQQHGRNDLYMDKG